MTRRALLLSSLLAAATWAGAAPARADNLCHPDDLPGVVAAWGRLQRQLLTVPAPLARPSTADPAGTHVTAAWDEFTRVASAVLSTDANGHGVDLDSIAPAIASRRPIVARCTAAVRARDRAAWQLLAAGYSAAEIGDVLTGRLTRAEVDDARRLLLAGYGAERAAEYLEAAAAAHERERVSATRHLSARPVPRRRPALPPALLAAVDVEAATHGVDPALVRAVIAAESGGDPAAVSPRGAVGPMQLMPATARMLGVDPWDPVQNVRGGVAYLAGLLRLYGDVTSALVAYNAGPTHADRVRRGEAVLYGETRRYLKAIGSQFPLSD